MRASACPSSTAWTGVNALQAKDFADPESLLSNTITPLGAASASQDYAYYGGLEKYTDGDTFDPDLALEYRRPPWRSWPPRAAPSRHCLLPL